MVHSGCNGGKKWATLTLMKNVNGEELWAKKIIEKFAGNDVVVFNSVKVAQEKWPNSIDDKKNGYFLRPQKVIQLEEEWLFNHSSFDYENHALFVNSKWFSLSSISNGLKRISEVLNQPLVFEEGEKNE
jgi:hypothetical protein